ncbi:amino acid adenylation domain-containing protein [Micromonospora craniellae]|uniref:Phenyloxazoline synthase MbtB n=2 Tax=Micromonospora craniellae TaxID=2294034 RepID=A0A372G643_9ACTN|nr:amino acid adenylation domain-containing protein [Micromonospora craniellae]RFS48495.1 amino acid adenylation domain-containing protein [Micromonospora craniellae]
MACRFPGAPDVDAFWRNLRDGVESITELTDEELSAEGVPRDLYSRDDYVRSASVLDGVDLFDAAFFNIPGREAALLDPQQRLFLETSWHALEDAGRGPGTDSDVAVFAGANMPAYLMSNLLGGRPIVMSPSVFELQIHNDKDYLASRTSFLLGLTGPAVSVQTACSSSLVAVHQAARALLAGECGTALAGGVCVRVPHRVGYLFEEGLIYSPDGHCRPFDADGRGTVFGNGVGVVVLRRLADALADGDRVLAVLRASAVNNDGSDKVGYTAPSVAGQERLVSAALAAGGLDARTITAVEAHGTATAVGDPIEIKALSRAFAAHTSDTGFCAVGSVKGNIGHLESAAGVASLIKAVLQLGHRSLVPTLHFQTPNPRIAFDDSPFRVSTKLSDWGNGTHPRRIGISSFGIGGTNAHVILEEAPAAPPAALPERVPQIVVLSARSPRALDQAAQDLSARLGADPDSITLADVAATTQLGRGALPFRRALVARDTTEAAALLAGADPARVAGALAPPDPPRLVFLFPGQGTQYPGMGQDLYRDERLFRSEVDTCAEILAPMLGADLREVMYPETELDPDTAADRLADTAFAQPALFVTEYALARQLDAWGVRPDAMVGHSLGEFVAACLAGVFELPDVLRLIAMRGVMMRDLPSGAMASVAAPEKRVRELLASAGLVSVSVAAVNGPGLCVVSGPHPAIADVRALLDSAEIPTRMLHTSHAFHSSMIDPIVPAYTDLVRQTGAARRATTPIASTVTGAWMTDAQATDPEYWGTHMRLPVRFGDAVRTVTGSERTALLEIGPGNTLGTLSRHSVESVASTTVLSTLRRADQNGSDQDTLLSSVAGLWLAGVPVDWARMQAPRSKITLPGYPFQRRRYWVAPSTVNGAAGVELVVDTPAPKDADTDTQSSRPAHLLTTYTAPRDEVEGVIAALWEEFFGIQPIGVHDNFFELGGHSLLATQVLNRVRAELGRPVTPAQLLSRPTIAALAELLADQATDSGVPEALPVVTPEPDRRHEPFPLTEMQQAQWIGRLGSFDMGGVAPHLYLEFDSDDLELHRLEQAWRQVVRRHEMLRIVVLADGRQRVLADVPAYRIELLDLRGEQQENADEQLTEVSDRMATEVRPADTWPLWEIRATRLASGTLRVHISFDLLCADVASFFYQVLPSWRDFYHDPALPGQPPELSFRDYVLAEENLRGSALYEHSLAYWRERVRALPPAPELPTAVAPGELARPTFVRRHAVLDAELWAAIREQAGEHGVTPSSVLVAAYAATVARWSKSQHFTLNFTAVNRLPVHEDVDGMVGEFASFELLEVDARSPRTFADLVAQVQRQAWEDFEHRYVSGVRILRELNRARQDTTGAVMPVVFTSALPTDRDPTRAGSPVAWLGTQNRFISQTPQVTIDHFVLEFDGVLELAWHAVDELFPDGLMADMFAAYQDLLVGLANADGWERPPSADLPAHQLSRREQVNATAGPLPDGLIVEPVLAAGTDPATADRVAVVTDERTLSHAELGGRAVELARTLAARGLGPGSLVGIGIAKGWRQVVAAVGVSAAGCTYVPIDPELPTSRRAWLIDHAGVDCVVIADEDAGGWPTATVTVADGPDWRAVDIAAWQCPADRGDIAYIIYTSGSTGTPKGVAVTHTAARNTLDDVRERFGITSADRVLGLSSLSFDLSVFDVFGVLGAGGALVLPTPTARRDPAVWIELVRAHGVTVWNTVPALLEMLVTHVEARQSDTPLPLRLAMLSGDWIPVRLPDRVRALVPDLAVVSLGGATEAAIWSIHYPVQDVPASWTSIPYGLPMRNQTFHVLNERWEPTPVWTAGHLYIGGAGLASGYWNDERRTSDSFVTHPGSGERLYRTGDLGRYLPDGTIEFLGREDFQVKIGGFRVELGEVEHAIATHPGVSAAVATAIGPRTQQRLVAYLVAVEPDAELSATELVASVRSHLVDTLPGYLIPADILVLDALPLSANGKVDRSALPAPDRVGAPAGETVVEERLRATVERLTALAQTVLGVPAVDAGDNFFSLGGDSIMGIQLVSQAAAVGLPLAPQDLFESDTFLDLARRIVVVEDEVVDTSVVPLTAHQASLYVAGAVRWVQVAATPGFDPSVAGLVLGELVARHTALRLRAGGEGAEAGPPGLHDGGVLPDIAEIDLGGLPESGRAAAIAELVDEMSDELDLAVGEGVKVAHITVGDGEGLLVWLGAAAALDDGSLRLLLSEFAHAYRQVAAGGSVDWTDRPACFLDWARGRHRPAPALVTPGLPSTAAALTGETVTTLDADTVTALRQSAFAAYHVDFAETVAAALVVAMRSVSDDTPVLVERALREPAVVGTAGRFTDLVVLTAAQGVGPAQVLSSVKREHRAPAVEDPPAAPLLLREVIDVDWPEGDGTFTLAGFTGPDGTRVPGDAVAEVSTALVDGALRVRWRGTATRIAAVFPAAVEAVIEQCRTSAEGSYTPSDFPLAGLDADELSAFLSTLHDERQAT